MFQRSSHALPKKRHPCLQLLLAAWRMMPSYKRCTPSPGVTTTPYVSILGATCATAHAAQAASNYITALNHCMHEDTIQDQMIPCRAAFAVLRVKPMPYASQSQAQLCSVVAT